MSNTELMSPCLSSQEPGCTPPPSHPAKGTLLQGLPTSSPYPVRHQQILKIACSRLGPGSPTLPSRPASDLILSAAASTFLSNPILFTTASHPQKYLSDHTILLKTLPWSPVLGSFHPCYSPSPHPTCQIAIIRHLKCCPPATYFKPQLRCSSSVTPAFSPQYPLLPTPPLLCPSDPRVCKSVHTPSPKQRRR